MNTSHVGPDKPVWRRGKKGQSLVELALAMPVLLILLSGVLEFGFALNQYLNALDAAREGARYAADGDPTARDLRAANTFTPPLDCTHSTDFYILTSCVAQTTMAPVPLNPATDDIVISVFRVLNGNIFGRWPNCSSGTPFGTDPTQWTANSSCPNDPPFIAHSGVWPETMGEWHQWGRGDQCANKLDDNGDGNADEGCNGNISPTGFNETTCDPKTDFTCNPSRFTSAQIQALLDPTAPNTAVVLVEVFYNYNQILKLPWITAFVPDPQRLHSYTIIPVPAAEPSLTITGTVTNKSDGSPKPDVTINFSNGIVAVTEPDGSYVAHGFDSTPITVTATFPGCIPNPLKATNGNFEWDLTPVGDVSDINFIADCPLPTSTPTASATASATSTGDTPTPTNTATSTATSTQTQTPTITPTPTSTPICTAGVFSPTLSSLSLQSPSDGIVQSDGTSTADLVATLLDNCHNPFVNHPVTLVSSRGNPPDIINPASLGSDTTNANGQAFFTVSSSVMSPWDPNANGGNGAFTPSVLSAQYLGTTFDTRNVTFVCVRGQGVPAGGNNEVFWQFTNNTGITRRLTRVDVTWPQATGRLLQVLQFNGNTIWHVGANFSPVTINSNFDGSPVLRNINNGSADSLLVTFNFLVTGAQQYTVKAFWDDTNGGSTCDSGSVTVVRGGASTSTPTATVPGSTSTPTATVPGSTSTPTTTRTPTATAPASTSTATPTPTATTPVPPTKTATPTATPTPTATTPVPPTSTATATATATTTPSGPSITGFSASPNPANNSSSPPCGVNFSANITTDASQNISSAVVLWTATGASAGNPSSGSSAMSNTSGNTWSVNIVVQLDKNGFVTWQVQATDTASRSITTDSGISVGTTQKQCQ